MYHASLRSFLPARPTSPPPSCLPSPCRAEARQRGQPLALCIFGDPAPQWVVWQALDGGALITTATAYQATHATDQKPPLLWLTDQELTNCALAESPEWDPGEAQHARVRKTP